MNNEFTVQGIKKILAEHFPATLPPPVGLKPASVLVPFYPDPNGLSLVLMKRPDYQGPHGGQISFPGGAKDDNDTDNLQAALRETEEEIGVDRNEIEVWGRLSSKQTVVSKYWITPFVGLIPFPYNFKPNDFEVERLIVIPFSHLMNPGNFAFEDYEWKGRSHSSYLYTYGEDVIWGLTARILHNLISLLTVGRES